MNSTPRDARLAIVAILLATSMLFLPKPAPSPHVEHHHIKRAAPAPAHTFTVGYHIIETKGPYFRLEQDAATKQLVWRMWKPFPTWVEK